MYHCPETATRDLGRQGGWGWPLPFLSRARDRQCQMGRCLSGQQENLWSQGKLSRRGTGHSSGRHHTPDGARLLGWPATLGYTTRQSVWSSL